MKVRSVLAGNFCAAANKSCDQIWIYILYTTPIYIKRLEPTDDKIVQP